ncbi:MAG: hypothetical protein AAFX08_09800 [Pseudomonadota bacterium]
MDILTFFRRCRAAAMAVAIAVTSAACAELTLAWTALEPKGEAAAPAIAPAASRAEWEEARAPALRQLLQDNVYGRMPDAARTELLDRRLVDAGAFEGRGRYEELRIRPTAIFGGVEARAPGGDLIMALITPTAGDGPFPVIIMQTFCARQSAAPHPEATQPNGGPEMGGVLGAVATYVFGRYICTPPYEDILDAGYAVAVMSPGDIVPDRREEGVAALAALSAQDPDDPTRWGAIAAWGWLYSRAVDALEDDARIHPSGYVVWGHSRYGKAALVAAAFDDRIDAVIAHQSGTGGASLNWDKKGESVGSIVGNYPHWFAPAYARLSEASDGEGARPAFDQHMLLALVAPRPMLLGNARRDVWSDPNGAFRAAQGAAPAYAAYGLTGLDQTDLSAFEPGADIAYWLRSGTHGVVEEDWPAFLSFLNAHFKTTPGAP